jgi:DNA-3-methyladenine glycosylase
MSVLLRRFYDRKSTVVARDLIGKRLVRILSDGRTIEGIIVETEAYGGTADPASHAYKGMTRRNEVMFGEAGHAYVYFTYGFHYCLNFVTNSGKERAGAVLIRAVEPTNGIDFMMERRGTKVFTQLASGPGKLCQAFSIDKSFNGVDVTNPESPIYVRESDNSVGIETSPRVGINSATEREWRFYANPNAFVSRAHFLLTERPRRKGS